MQTGVVAPLEDADDAVKNIGRDASRLDELETNMKAAQKATSKYEGELRNAIDAQRRAARGARDIGDDAEVGFHKARQNVEEFKDEARQNFSEVTSSFDGSMQSVLDLAQGTFGGLASSLAGPLGIAAGLGAAVLGGVFTSMSTSADENAQKAEERISAMYDDFLESGNNYRTKDQVAAAIKDLVSDTEKWKKAQDDAKQSGLDISLILQAQAGDANALAQVQAALKEKYDAAAEASDKYVLKKGPQAAAASAEKLAMQQLIEEYSNYSGQSQTAAQKANAVRDAMNALGLQSDGTAKQISGIKSTLDQLPATKNVTVTATTDAAVAKINALTRQYNNSEISVFVTGKTRAGERVF
ncbi:hypothetical protein [Leifsonia virtsii]|uniref:Uncharacterized protein n=1 Tax=Leifsonia virtsii TaxID=3035915 RepID=A0ABT8J3I8_9MICO|nr:hypothetical protein [Leifsonia virtsii]MDN4598844.1 hypothetical protein [Leifsonia virtsii]